MHLCRSRIAYGLLAVFAGCLSVQAAVVYKWTDADGVVHFSDQPDPGRRSSLTFSGSSRGVDAGAQARTARIGETQGRPRWIFSQFAIISPGHEETITGNQPVNVQLARRSRTQQGDAGDHLVFERQRLDGSAGGCNAIHSHRPAARHVHPLGDGRGPAVGRIEERRFRHVLRAAHDSAVSDAQGHALSRRASRRVASRVRAPDGPLGR